MIFVAWVTLALFILGCQGEQNATNLPYENLSVALEYNGTCFSLNWSRLLNCVTEPVITELWKTARVVEGLGVTLQKKENLWRVSGTQSPLSGGNLQYSCGWTREQLKFNLTADFNYSALPGYLGDFGVASDGLLSNVFTSAWTVGPAHQREYEAFYSMNLSALRMFAALGNEAPGTRLVGYVSSELVLVTLVNQTATGNDTGAHLMFGLTRALPSLAGYLTYGEVTVALDANYSLVAIVPASAFDQLGENLTHLFLEVRDADADDFIRATVGRMFGLESMRQCASPAAAWHNLALFFRAALSYFLVFGGIREQAFVNATCVCRQVADLDLLTRLLGLCYPTLSVGGYERSALEKLAAAQIRSLPAGALATLSLAHQETVLDMFALGVRDGDLPAVIVEGLERIVDQMYTAYSYVYVLEEADRRLLLDIYAILTANQSRLHEVSDRRLLLTFMRITSMCTNLEIAEMVSRFASPHARNLYAFFSPCFLALRYDLTREKLRFEAPQTAHLTRMDLALGTSGFWELLHDLHLGSSAALPAVNCTRIAATNVIATLHLEHVTYVISPGPLPDARVYEISEIFLKSAMFISALKPNCSKFDTTPGTVQIPVVYNISAPRSGCPLCHSVILSYDERQGLQSLMYITNAVVQANVFQKNSPFFANDNLHVHYLWLMDNGTVVEVRGLYRRRAVSVLYMLLLLVGVVGSIYFIYRLFAMLV
ncbi:ORF22 [Retroperitoneal fibromatosis-associated herpesvirus]|uniref:ORF22 n=1 Tax=Retroperitoneal fibromatosis-associated herpesvirus TaxID=111469 RepID=U5NIC7_9GAMA|nr:ORF22 [Retroperitoneal fibromatosis-associated herpesvirus]AGY30705.1 ORF22 [Retroperitoneal fibromatosis-associated herpesvirus]